MSFILLRSIMISRHMKTVISEQGFSSRRLGLHPLSSPSSSYHHHHHYHHHNKHHEDHHIIYHHLIISSYHHTIIPSYHHIFIIITSIMKIRTRWSLPAGWDCKQMIIFPPVKEEMCWSIALHCCIWTNTFCDSDKYILQSPQIHL